MFKSSTNKNQLFSVTSRLKTKEKQPEKLEEKK